MTVTELIEELRKLSPDLEVRTSPCLESTQTDAERSRSYTKAMNTSNPVVEVEEYEDQVCLWREV